MKILKILSTPLALLGQLWQSKAISKLFRWNILIIILQIIYLTVNFTSLPSQVPLFYSRPWGEARLSSPSFLFMLPTFSTIILLINYLLAAAFLHSIPLFSHLLTTFSFLFSSFSLISITQIIRLIS